jgi:hypothetical protein
MKKMQYSEAVLMYLLDLEANNFEEYMDEVWEIDDFTLARPTMLDRALSDENVDHIYKDAIFALREVRDAQNNTGFLDDGFNVL